MIEAELYSEKCYEISHLSPPPPKKKRVAIL